MPLIIAAIGRAKADSPESRLCDEYIRRTSANSWAVTLKELTPKKALTGPKLLSEETRLLLEATDSTLFRVALDERGQNLTTAAFAKKLGDWQTQGNGSVAFLLGGADGLSDEARAACQFKLALGSMTWPHMLARAMLCEQIYRAWTLSTGHPYHRG